MLLAASIPARPGQSVLEAGTGAGAALLCLGHRVPGLAGTGVERDPAMAALARHNLAANTLPFAILTADVTTHPSLQQADHVLANPPWHDPASTRPPDARRAAATHRAPAGLEAWVAALAPLVCPGGTLTLALPMALIPAAQALLDGQGLPGQTVMPLCPRAGQPAKIALLRAVHAPEGRHIAPGLVLHPDGPGYTEAAEAILRHGAALPA